MQIHSVSPSLRASCTRVQLMNMAEVPCKVLCCGVETVQEIIDLVSIAEENDRLCNRIIQQAETLKPMLMELQGQPQTVLLSITALQKHLDKCKEFMSELNQRRLALPRHILQSRSCHRQLDGLNNELSGAIKTLNLAVSVMNLNNIANLQHFVVQEVETLQRNIANPHAGVYSLTSHILPPCSTVVVTIEAKYVRKLEEIFLFINWKDVDNTDTVTEYEVQYDEQKGLSVYKNAREGPHLDLVGSHILGVDILGRTLQSSVLFLVQVGESACVLFMKVNIISSYSHLLLDLGVNFLGFGTI